MVNVAEFVGRSRILPLIKSDSNPAVAAPGFSDFFSADQRAPSSVWPQPLDACARGRGDVLGNGLGGDNDAFNVKHMQEGLRALLPKGCTVHFAAPTATNMVRPSKTASPPAPTNDSKCHSSHYNHQSFLVQYNVNFFNLLEI